MQPPAEIKVWEFDWDEENLTHCELHEVTPELAQEVMNASPMFFLNRPGKTGTHIMIGPDANRRFWTIILLETPTEGLWRPITGWPSTNTEIAWYNATA